MNVCTANTSDFLRNLFATSRKLVSQAAFSTYREKLVYGALRTTGLPNWLKMSVIRLWCMSSLFTKIVGMNGTLYFLKRSYWWILFPQIWIDSGSSTTFKPSSAAVFETM